MLPAAPDTYGVLYYIALHAMSGLPTCHAEHPTLGLWIWGSPDLGSPDLGVSRSGGVSGSGVPIWGSGVRILGWGSDPGVGWVLKYTLYIISPRARGTVNYKLGYAQMSPITVD